MKNYFLEKILPKIFIISIFLILTGLILIACLQIKAVIPQPTDNKGYYEKAIKYIEAGDYEEAEKCIHKMDKGYKNSLLISHYLFYRRHAWYPFSPQEILSTLNVPDNYDGDLADEINEFVRYISDDYPAVYYAEYEKRLKQAELEREREESRKQREESSKFLNSSKTGSNYTSSSYSSDVWPDCDDYDSYDEFMDDWDGYMPDGSDAEDYWDNW